MRFDFCSLKLIIGWLVKDKAVKPAYGKDADFTGNTQAYGNRIDYWLIILKLGLNICL
jgi:hypothetical protein